MHYSPSSGLHGSFGPTVPPIPWHSGGDRVAMADFSRHALRMHSPLAWIQQRMSFGHACATLMIAVHLYQEAGRTTAIRGTETSLANAILTHLTDLLYLFDSTDFFNLLQEVNRTRVRGLRLSRKTDQCPTSSQTNGTVDWKFSGALLCELKFSLGFNSCQSRRGISQEFPFEEDYVVRLLTCRALDSPVGNITE